MRIHIVRSKETFVTIANKYQVTLDDLRQFNPDFIQPDCLVAGMKVYIPNLKKSRKLFKTVIIIKVQRTLKKLNRKGMKR
jgi:spore germination protein YaaH